MYIISRFLNAHHCCDQGCTVIIQTQYRPKNNTIKSVEIEINIYNSNGVV